LQGGARPTTRNNLSYNWWINIAFYKASISSIIQSFYQNNCKEWQSSWVAWHNAKWDWI